MPREIRSTPFLRHVINYSEYPVKHIPFNGKNGVLNEILQFVALPKWFIYISLKAENSHRHKILILNLWLVSKDKVIYYKLKIQQLNEFRIKFSLNAHDSNIKKQIKENSGRIKCISNENEQ